MDKKLKLSAPSFVRFFGVVAIFPQRKRETKKITAAREIRYVCFVDALFINKM